MIGVAPTTPRRLPLQSRRKLKVGFAIQSIGPDLDSNHAVALQMRHIINGLRTADHDVTVLALGHERIVTKVENAEATSVAKLRFTGKRYFKIPESGIRRVQTVSQAPYLGLFDSLRFYEASLLNLSRSNVLPARSSLLSFGAAMASKRMAIPYVLSHDADEFYELEYVGKPLAGIQRIVAKMIAEYNFSIADAIVCVSKAAKEHLIQRWNIPQGKIEVVPNGVDLVHFRDQSRSAAIRSELGVGADPVVLFVGGFYPWHGVGLLIEAFRKVNLQIPSAKLVLVGDGSTRLVVEKRIDHLSLSDSVVMTGAVDYADIPHYLGVADVAVAPYLKFGDPFWGSPMKIFEYMAAGKAIVASAVGQIREVIRHGETGILVKPGNEDALAHSIIELLEDSAKREMLGRNAKLTAERYHSWDRHIQQLENVYAHVA